MYRARQYHISKKNKLYHYCQDVCRSSAVLYNRANFVLRQYASAVRSFDEMIPLYENPLNVYREVNDILSDTKHEPKGAWLNYYGLDHFLKATKDVAYYAMPSQANQQTLKLIMRDYKSFFEALKAYKSDKSGFTGRPHMPKYVRGRILKTAVLTNQICSVKDGHLLKFPGTVHRLELGEISMLQSLKEVRIKPHGRSFVMDVVFSAPDTGIDIKDDKAILSELAKKDNTDDMRILAIDPGTDNIAAVANNFGAKPFVIKGGILKSANQFYNKEMARLSNAAKLCNGRYRTARMDAITEKRNRYIKDQLHKISRTIADYARNNDVSLVIMGHNKMQKSGVDIGHVNNQNFVQLPIAALAVMLRYKLAEYGIRFVLAEESYTSKADFLALDSIPTYGKETDMNSFSGKRIKRGLYRHYDGTVTNADINGAGNILRKVFPKVTQWDRGIVDMPCLVGCPEHTTSSCCSAA